MNIDVKMLMKLPEGEWKIIDYHQQGEEFARKHYVFTVSPYRLMATISTKMLTFSNYG